MILKALIKSFQNHIGFAVLRAKGKKWEAVTKSLRGEGVFVVQPLPVSRALYSLGLGPQKRTARAGTEKLHVAAGECTRCRDSFPESRGRVLGGLSNDRATYAHT